MAAEGTPMDHLSYILSHGTWHEVLESWEEILKLLLTPDISPIVEVIMAAVMVVTGIAACLTLIFIPAPYGRYAEGASRAFGPGVPVRLAWLVQESPAFLVPVAILLFISAGTRWVYEAWSAMWVKESNLGLTGTVTWTDRYMLGQCAYKFISASFIQVF